MKTHCPLKFATLKSKTYNWLWQKKLKNIEVTQITSACKKNSVNETTT